MWEYEYVNTLGNGGQDIFRFRTGPKPVGLFDTHVTSTGTRGLILDYYFEGVFGGTGVDIEGYPMNHHDPKPAPFTLVQRGEIPLGGTLIASRQVGDVIEAGTFHVPLILREQRDYHIDITNLHNQSADITITIAASVTLTSLD